MTDVKENPSYHLLFLILIGMVKESRGAGEQQSDRPLIVNCLPVSERLQSAQRTLRWKLSTQSVIGSELLRSVTSEVSYHWMHAQKVLKCGEFLVELCKRRPFRMRDLRSGQNISVPNIIEAVNEQTESTGDARQPRSILWANNFV